MIEVVVLNADMDEVEYTWENFELLKEMWEDGMDFPMLDDAFVRGSIDGEEFSGVDFATLDDFMSYLSGMYDWDY